MQIQRAQKDTDDLTVFFTNLGSVCVKAVHKTLAKLTPSDWQKYHIFSLSKKMFITEDKFSILKEKESIMQLPYDQAVFVTLIQ